MTKVLIVVGSLRKGGFNSQLAEKIAGLIGDRAEVSTLDWADVPLLNQDLEWPAPAAVARVRAEVAAADGIWFVTPEYNGQIPGGLKNLTDWLSRSLDQNDPRAASAIDSKVTTVSGASASGSKFVRSQLEQLLEFIRTDVVTDAAAGAPINGGDWATGELTYSEETEAAIAAHVEAFLAKLGA